MLLAALVDVGGTLWPERLAVHNGSDKCVEQLRGLLPGVDAVLAYETLRRTLQEDDRSLVQDTQRLLSSAVRGLGLNSADVDITAVRRALCVPAAPVVQLFAGAAELLHGLRRLGLRNVIVSNVQVRGALEYDRDFADLNVAQYVDAVVTSLDVGFRKPDQRFFEAALAHTGCPPDACVMIGNSEANDITPAVALGMRAIRVAIEEPPPESSAADAVVTSLEAAHDIVKRWVDAGA